MTLTLARHYGMCFGVRDALRSTTALATQHPITVLGQLVHNPVVSQFLEGLGAKLGQLEAYSASTSHVVVTAHGAAESQRQRWKEAGYDLTDTTCPLVRKAHTALAQLVANDYFPVVIGTKGHIEVKGLLGDFPQAVAVETEADFALIPTKSKLGIVSQTTQPSAKVSQLIDSLKKQRPEAEVKFIDTVCQPTKDRQSALIELCANCDVIVVIGGKHSNNTKQLVETAVSKGLRAYQIETADELRQEWFGQADRVGLTAGTSTLDETIHATVEALQRIAACWK